jgi:hypothetical protein
VSYPYRQARYDYGARKGPVLGFVVHMAEGGGTVGYLAGQPARGVSVHYVIEYSGLIVQMLNEAHASGSINPQTIRTGNDADGFYGISAAQTVLGQWVRDPNAAVISLEIEGYARQGPNDQQAAALRKLVADVRSRHPGIGLLGHRDFQDVKACPGRLIAWDELGGHAETMANHTRTITELAYGGTYTIEPGALPTAVQLDAMGNVAHKRTWPGASTVSTAHYDATVTDDGTTGNPFYRCTDGYFAGFLISSSQVVGRPNAAPPPPTDCTAELAQLKARIVAAVEGITT